MTNCTGQKYKVCSGAIKIANIADLKKKKKIEKKALEQFGSKTEIKELLNKLEEEFKKKEEEEKEKEEQFQLLGGFIIILYGTINLRILDNLWKREPAQQK